MDSFSNKNLKITQKKARKCKQEIKIEIEHNKMIGLLKYINDYIKCKHLNKPIKEGGLQSRLKIV